MAELAWEATATEEATTQLRLQEMLTFAGRCSGIDQPRNAGLRLDEVLVVRDLTVDSIPDWALPDVPVTLANNLAVDIGHAIAAALRSYAAWTRDTSTWTPEPVRKRGGLDFHDAADLDHFFNKLVDTEDGVGVLTACAAYLGRSGVMNYRLIRDGMRSLRRIPPRVMLEAFGTDSQVDDRDAAAWLWNDLTQGTLYASPHNATRRHSVAKFATATPPEALIRLREYGLDHLHAPAAVVGAEAQPDYDALGRGEMRA